MRAHRALLLLGVTGLALGGLLGCDETPEGTLELHWSVNGLASPAACTATGVSTVRVLTDHQGEDPDADPTHPTWPYVDLPCADLSGRIALAEGIYRVRLVALDGAGEVRSQVAEFQGIQVVADQTVSLPRNPDVEAPIALEVPICGDGVVQTGEWCDGEDLGGYDCQARGYDGGRLACAPGCTLDESLCTRCGDGVIDAGESCDGSELDGETCVSLGLAGGELACASDCTFDRSSCLGCGNGAVEGAEQCDDGNRVAGDGCSPDCRLEQGPLAVSWVVRASDATTLSDCASESIAEVELAVSLAGVGTVVDATRVPCAAGSAVLPDLGYGLYTVRLSGRSAGDIVVAEGASAPVDHSDPDGGAVAVDLVALP